MTSTAPCPMLRVEDLGCIRGDDCLFEGLSFDIDSADIVRIQGANGSGKTTLLRILAGLTLDFEGRLAFRGQSLDDVRDDYMADMLYIGHRRGLSPDLTAYENLRWYRSLHGDRAVEMTALAAVEMADHATQPCGRMSAGQSQRVALARLWLTRASLWLLDEPLTAMDRRGVRLVAEKVEQHRASGGAVIYATHSPLSGVEERVLEL